MFFNHDDRAQIILCTPLKYIVNDEMTMIKPFTTHAYNNLESKLNQAGVGPGIFLTEKIEDTVELLGLTEKESEHVKQLLIRVDKLEEEIKRLAALDIHITTRMQENYPLRLKRVMGTKAPVVLYYSGKTGLLKKATVGIVGSRKATIQECDYAAEYAKMSVQKGATVISGGAAGIDIAAQRSALDHGGDVVTYVSENMAKYVYKHLKPIQNGNMLVLSACHPDMFFRNYNALERNKYIYASSDHAVVVASADGTGGSFRGAEQCIKNKYTKLYVKNDAYATQGNRTLIGLGALPLI